MLTILPGTSEIRGAVMRILLISSNKSREIMPAMPVGVAVLKSVLPDHEVAACRIISNKRDIVIC